VHPPLLSASLLDTPALKTLDPLPCLRLLPPTTSTASLASWSQGCACSPRTSYLVRARRRQDRLGARWDSRMGSSSYKTISWSSTHPPSENPFPSRNGRVLWSSRICRHADKFFSFKPLVLIRPFRVIRTSWDSRPGPDSIAVQPRRNGK